MLPPCSEQTIWDIYKSSTCFISLSTAGTSEVEEHLIKLMSWLLLCRLIFEVNVNKTTPKCCITAWQRNNHQERGGQSDPAAHTKQSARTWTTLGKSAASLSPKHQNRFSMGNNCLQPHNWPVFQGLTLQLVIRFRFLLKLLAIIEVGNYSRLGLHNCRCQL